MKDASRSPVEQSPVERWKDVPGYGGRYKVSNLGVVKSFARFEDGRVIGSPRQDGYHMVSLSLNKRVKTHFIHRLVCELFNGPAPTIRHVVNHIDGDKGNNAAANLEWVTRSDNGQHAAKIGLVLTGDDSPFTKIPDASIVEMRERYADDPTMSYGKLAETYGVHIQYVAQVIRGETRQHAGGPIKPPDPRPEKMTRDQRRIARALLRDGETPEETERLVGCSLASLGKAFDLGAFREASPAGEPHRANGAR